MIKTTALPVWSDIDTALPAWSDIDTVLLDMHRGYFVDELK